MVHVHTPDHGSCGSCPGAKSCPMKYCPTCPTPVLCEQREAGITTGQPAGTFGQPERTTPAAPRPALGRVVHVLVHPTLNNGSDVAPAVITRVHPGRHHDGSDVVNLRVFLDGTNRSHEWATSRHLHATEDTARLEHAGQLDRLDGLELEHTVCVSRHAFWPART